MVHSNHMVLCYCIKKNPLFFNGFPFLDGPVRIALKTSDSDGCPAVEHDVLHQRSVQLTALAGVVAVLPESGPDRFLLFLIVCHRFHRRGGRCSSGL